MAGMAGAYMGEHGVKFIKKAVPTKVKYMFVCMSAPPSYSQVNIVQVDSHIA